MNSLFMAGNKHGKNLNKVQNVPQQWHHWGGGADCPGVTQSTGDTLMKV